MSKAEQYYYNMMNKNEKTAYHAILSGLESCAASIAIPRLDGRTLTEIYFMIRLDHPEIFYSEKFTCRFYQNADSMELIPEYLYTKKQIKAHQQAMQARITKLTRPVKDKNEREKEQYVHDFICENVTYDKLKKPYSHEIIGPLGHGIGVCEGIAKTVKVLCDALGVWCIIPICDANPDKGIRYRHTWNLLKFGGQYYHMDATYDLSLSKCGFTRYDYYNIDDQSIFRDHEPLIYPMPACKDTKLKYYVEKKQSFTTYEEVRKRCAQAVKKGKTFLFHWRGGYLTREVLSDLLEIFAQEAAKKDKKARLSLNWHQAVLCVNFITSDATDEEHYYVLEKANED